VNLMPMGSGALAGNSFGIDRAALARDLGFDGITRNSMDVSGDRDFALDFLSAASMVMLHLSRLAEDWILYSSEEFGWLELGDGVTSGSSLMPQKKNPDSLELTRGKCGRVFGAFTSLYTTMKGLPMTYNRDMQEDKEPLFDAADQLAVTLEMARVVVETTSLRPGPPRTAAEEGWLVATDLAEALARSGVPFHQAHRLVGSLVLESSKSGKQPGDWTPEALAAFNPLFTAEIAKLLDPAEGIRTRTAPGGTAPETVAAALREARARLEKL
jgi:argininosuccinate lyase